MQKFINLCCLFAGVLWRIKNWSTIESLIYILMKTHENFDAIKNINFHTRILTRGSQSLQLDWYSKFKDLKHAHTMKHGRTGKISKLSIALVTMNRSWSLNSKEYVGSVVVSLSFIKQSSCEYLKRTNTIVFTPSLSIPHVLAGCSPNRIHLSLQIRFFFIQSNNINIVNFFSFIYRLC